MGSAPSAKKNQVNEVTADCKDDETTENTMPSDVAEAFAGKAALAAHKVRLENHPEIQEVLPNMKAAVQTIDNNANKAEITEGVLREIAEAIEDDIEQICYTYDSKEQRRLICDQLGYDGMIPACGRFYRRVLKGGTVLRSDLIANTMFSMLNIITSLTDRSEMICQQCKHEGLLDVLLEGLNDKELQEKHTSNPMSYRFCLMYLGVVYNCAKGNVSRQFFNQHNAVNIVDPYTKSTDKTVKALSVMAIAYIMEEDEQNDLIVADKTLIRYVIRTFNEAINTSDKTSLEGFSVEELAQGLSSLANHDKNKKIIVEAGALPLLVQLMKEGDEKEIFCATRAVWTLGFDDDNKGKIKQEPGAVERLEQLKSHDSQRIQQAANGALWVIQGDQRFHEKKEHSFSDKGSREGGEDISEECSDHVMISYQWDVQKLMLKLKQQLEKNGYRVWMDLDQMGGSTLQAMADAVENAAVVLVCVSQKYKDSPNCRVEGEYAFQQRKKIVPLMVEENYRPTGWLGAIVGTKFYIDFAKKTQPFGVCVQQLIKQLADDGKAIKVKKAVAKAVGDVGTVPDRPSTAHPCSDWTNQKVVEWLRSHDVKCKALTQLTGEDIVFLQHMRAEAPEFFYYYMVRNLGIKDIPQMRRLRNALDKLGQ
ncbi:uncharacterized protein LOC144439756 [Glandiceps talaboti]